MSVSKHTDVPIGTRALILSKYYYGVLSRRLEGLEVERYYSVLYFLHENDGSRQQCICDHLSIDKTAMVKVIAYLIKAGFVQRKVNPVDRREHFIYLTKKGAVKTNEVVKNFRAIDEQMFLGISTKEKEVFLKVMLELSDTLKKLPGNDLFFNYKKTSTPAKR
ncbi:MAG: winged helix DNA-binding protein [bacterium]|nr:winged helix DNA-binding protein [bacterium]